VQTNSIRLLGALMVMLAGPAIAAQGAEDALTFTTQCALCHKDNPAEVGSPNERAPTRAQLNQFTAEAVLTALTTGKMQQQGAILNDAQRRLVAEYATGKRLSATSVATAEIVNRCTADVPMRDPGSGPSWNGHGNGPNASRYQPAKSGKLTAENLPLLKLKWAFGYAGVGSARAQPTLAGGRLFVASENSEVHALNPKTGCTYWTFKAQAGVRTAVSVATYRTADRKQRHAVYFGDGRANAYAVDAQTGQQIWTRKIDDHPMAGPG
jgi:polyvinyl alcohol dehydrogenase (cytochrome)